MSKCDQDLKKMTEDRDKWMGIAQMNTQRLDAAMRELIPLRDKFATQQDDAALLGGEHGLLNDLRQQRDNYRRRAEAAEARVSALLQRYSQVEYILNPGLYDMSHVLETTPEESGGVSWRSDHPVTRVGYIIVAENPEEGQVKWFQDGGGYLGTTDDIQGEIERFKSSILRVPDMSDLQSPYIDKHLTVPSEEGMQLQLNVVRGMVYFHQVEHVLRGDEGLYDEKCDELFDVQIKPFVKPGMIVNAKGEEGRLSHEAEARRRLKESAQKTLQLITKRRGEIHVPRIEAVD